MDSKQWGSAESYSNSIKLPGYNIISICETYLKSETSAYIDEYYFHGHNRLNIPNPAIKGSGGVGVFVSNNIFSSYTAWVVDKFVDGILAILFVDKVSEFNSLLISCYLPPDGSPYANTSVFFNHLLSILYLHSSCDCVIICGDINAWIDSDAD